MFSNHLLRSFRILLLPFALLYWLGIGIRNWLYDKKIFKSASFGLPVICIGNLAVGGTGKSPMVEHLVQNLSGTFHVATLSRGYKRKTVGYALAGPDSTALEIGDEPMQFHQKFPGIAVAVGEKRVEAIPQLLHDRPDTQAIILDDAFQHRSIRAGLNILLTEYGNRFTQDFYLPAGDLRDLKSSYKRAEIIVITKCPDQIEEKERLAILREIKPLNRQEVYFTTLDYGSLFHINGPDKYNLDDNTEVLLVTGIANPVPLKKYLEEHCHSYHMLQYMDHHIYTIDDLKEIKKRFKEMDLVKKIILTTEKDAVRFEKFRAELSDLPFFVIPVKHRFLFGEEEKFNSRLKDFIKNFKTVTQ